MITAVLDCVVYVQAAISPNGPAAACVTLAEEGRFVLYVSPAVLQEIRETLSRKTFRRKFPHLTQERIEAFLQAIERSAEMRKDKPSAFSLSRDPDDEIYVHLAEATHANYLVSRDEDLLSLRKNMSFQKAHSRLSVVDPVEFLKRVRSGSRKKRG